ncbi:MAG: 50S ribosomal protein L22 [Candidatus Coatesbacteria bacterium]|nr:50S ribosomal protein L22 [Candidatus Coatesbacteria bacterium]
MGQASALLRFERVSFRKMKPIADLIRGKDADVAEKLLVVSKRRTGRIMLKLLRSAVANADDNSELGGADSLYVSRVDLGPGPTAKRARFKARGRVALIRHRTTHVRIVLEERVEDDGRKAEARRPVKEESKA